MIDLVAGRQSMFKMSALQDAGETGLDALGSGVLNIGEVEKLFESIAEEEKKALLSGPSFVNDAARIYLSQKTNIDEAFEIIKGKVGSPPNKSAVGIKADSVRLVGREGIKLVTYAGVDEPLLNSLGGPLGARKGIDLIGGNMDISPHDIQPMVKGLNMINCVMEVMKVTQVLKEQVSLLIDDMMDIQEDVQSHFHISPFFGSPTSASPTLKLKKAAWFLKMENRHFKLNAVDVAVQAAKLEYLSSTSKNSYICSQMNNTN